MCTKTLDRAMGLHWPQPKLKGRHKEEPLSVPGPSVPRYLGWAERAATNDPMERTACYVLLLSVLWCGGRGELSPCRTSGLPDSCWSGNPSRRCFRLGNVDCGREGYTIRCGSYHAFKEGMAVSCTSCR